MNRPLTPAVPVITIDGPTASGKGTIARGVGAALGWRVLDSGALYRLTALACLRAGVEAQDEAGVAQLARGLDVRFENDGIWLVNEQQEQEDVSRQIRYEDVGNLASRIAAQPAVRAALLARQRAFQKAPGLVADGRDMGTVVFPDAPLKIFLDAGVQARALRRCKQLKDKGLSANIAALVADMKVRDERDRNRNHAPLRPAEGAALIDSSSLDADEVIRTVLALWATRSKTQPPPMV